MVRAVKLDLTYSVDQLYTCNAVVYSTPAPSTSNHRQLVRGFPTTRFLPISLFDKKLLQTRQNLNLLEIAEYPIPRRYTNTRLLIFISTGALTGSGTAPPILDCARSRFIRTIPHLPRDSCSIPSSLAHYGQELELSGETLPPCLEEKKRISPRWLCSLINCSHGRR